MGMITGKVRSIVNENQTKKETKAGKKNRH